MNFSNLQTNLRSASTIIELEKSSLKDKLKDAQRVYRNPQQIVFDLKRAYQEKVERTRAEAKRDVKAWADDRRAELGESLLQPLGAKNIAVLTTYQMRHKVGEAELRTLMNTAPDNYQFLKIVQGIAERNGYELHLSCDYDEESKRIDDMEERLLAIANDIGSDEPKNSYYSIAFFGDYDISKKTSPFYDCFELENNKVFHVSATGLEKAIIETEKAIDDGDIHKAYETMKGAENDGQNA